jgi:hypothetical protein
VKKNSGEVRKWEIYEEKMMLLEKSLFPQQREVNLLHA